MTTKQKIKLTVISALIPFLGVTSYAEEPEAKEVVSEKVELTQKELDAIKLLIEGEVLVLGKDGKVIVNKEVSFEDQLKDLGIFNEISSSTGGWCF